MAATFKWSKISKRERVMIVVGAAVLLVVASDRLVLSPWAHYIKKVRNEIIETEIRVDQARKLFERKDATYKEGEAYRAFLNVGQTPELEMAALLREIEQLSQQADVSLQEVKPLPAEKTEDYDDYGVEVYFESEFPALLEFIEKVESSGFVLVIEKASIIRKDEESGLLKGFLRIKRLVMTQSAW